MSINTNRAKLSKAHNSHEYKIIAYFDDPWGEEWVTWHHGDLPNHKWREYKTWKHHRKTQYKKGV